MTQSAPLRRALLSVSDKTGLVAFARGLVELGVELVSTGGSAKALADAGLAVTEVASVTGFPEILDGRVKTLHPGIHGGILARPDLPEHEAAMAAHAIEPFQLVVVNLYPFRETVAAGAGFEDCVEKIDIGGPALIRAAAKNQAWVAIATDPADYPSLLEDLRLHEGRISQGLRRRLALEAYRHTASYDAAIAEWLGGQVEEGWPQRLFMEAALEEPLRYGENPHQKAAFYKLAGPGRKRTGVASARQLQGKALSYNNINDTDAAIELVAEFEEPAVAVIKHANPCGAAMAGNLVEAYRRAVACDPQSAFGGIVALNRPLDGETAEALAGLFLEVVVAPAFEPAALERLAGKTNLRLLELGELPAPDAPGRLVKSVSGGLMVQDRDSGRVRMGELEVVTQRKPTASELDDLLFAFRVAKHVKSNAIVYAREGRTVGIGAGQMSRVDSSRIAAWKAAEAAKAAGETSPRTAGSVCASDAFFPFADGLLAAVQAGATAVIQPGGSMRDEAVVAAADEAGIAMVFSGMRHFRH